MSQNLCKAAINNRPLKLEMFDYSLKTILYN